MKRIFVILSAVLLLVSCNFGTEKTTKQEENHFDDEHISLVNSVDDGEVDLHSQCSYLRTSGTTGIIGSFRQSIYYNVYALENDTLYNEERSGYLFKNKFIYSFKDDGTYYHYYGVNEKWGKYKVESYQDGYYKIGFINGDSITYYKVKVDSYGIELSYLE